MVGLVLLVDALAVYRLTRLATTDTLTRPARAWLIERSYRRAGDGQRWAEGHTTAERGDCNAWDDLATSDPCTPKLAALVTCRWCASVWAAGGVVLARCAVPDWWGPVGVLLALAAVGTLLAGLEA